MIIGEGSLSAPSRYYRLIRRLDELDPRLVEIYGTPLQQRFAAYGQRWRSRFLKLLHKINANVLASVDDLAPPKVQNTRLAALKSLRLCNKKLASRTAEFLFEEVLLHFRPESHAKLELISHHPIYKTYVRSLQIVPKPISEPLRPKNQLGLWIDDYRWLLAGPYVAHEHLDGRLAKWFQIVSSRKAIDIHYEEYSTLHSMQQKLLDTAEGVLQAAVGRLPQLNRVESGLYWDWDRRRQAIDPWKHPSSGWTREQLYLSSFDDLITKAGACRSKFDKDHGAIILRAVAGGKAASGVRVDIGPLLRDLETVNMQVARADEDVAIKSLMADIEHFCFYSNLAGLGGIAYSNLAGFAGMQEQMSPYSLAGFLQAMEKLACPSSRSENLGTDRPTNTLGNSIAWNRLNQLSIKGVDSLDLRCLAALIYRHKNGLRHLSLYDVVYHADAWTDWCNLWADLRAGALEEIRIWHLESIKTYKLSTRIGNRQGLPAMELRREAYELARSASPAHVFSGEAWSPELGSYIREKLVAPLFWSFAHAQPGLLAEDNRISEGAEREI